MGKGAQRTGGKRLVRTGRGVRRGQSELVGIVLLFGMVAFGALLVFAAGGTMLADVQERTKMASAQQEIEVLDDRLTRVADTRQPTDVPFGSNEDVDPTVNDGSRLAVSVAGCNRTINRTLGAVTYEFDDQALIYEGGGIWKETERGPIVRETPSISYDRRGGEPVFDMRLVDVTGRSDGHMTGVSFDETATQGFRRALEDLLAECVSEGDDLVVSIESRERSGAWAAAFEKTLHPDRYPEVEVSHDALTATATIHGIVDEGVAGENDSVTAPPGDVAVTILGTEASLHRTDDSECLAGPCKKGWLPITATVLFDGEAHHRFPADANQSGPKTLTHNLNTPAAHDASFTYRTELRERTEVTLQASLYTCQEKGFEEGYSNTPNVTGGPWDDKRCTGGLSDDPMVSVDPVANPDEGNLVALRDGDVVKNLEQPGVGQTSITDLLADKVDEDTGELDLADNQVVFLGELTQSDANYDEVDVNTTGDPNFNDFVVLLESEPGTELSTDGPRIRVTVDQVVMD